MKRTTLILTNCILYLFSFTNCDQKNTEVKKESWAVIINFFSPDTTYYPGLSNFPFPDTLRFEPLDKYFTNQDKKPVITDSTIIFDDNYRENGKKLCCIKDTLDIYIDSINGKKYLFAIGEYVSVFQSNNNADSNLRTRKPVQIPLWGVQLNVPYPPERFKNMYEKLGARFVKIDPAIDEVSRQTWNDNDSILVETIQFTNSSDRVITSVYKDMSEDEMRSFINNLKDQFPAISYTEALQLSNNRKLQKVVKMYLQGIALSFTQNDTGNYSFVITDYYETLKLILKNAGNSYVFRDELKIY